MTSPLPHFLAAAARVGPTRAITQLFRTCVIKHGRIVGHDASGNLYLESSNEQWGRDRWVEPARGDFDASEVPAEWHAWLHRMTDVAPVGEEEMMGGKRVGWMVPHEANPTGGEGAYRPYNTVKPKVEFWKGG